VRSTTVHALVLAAGAARRFGSPKGLADYRGRPLIRHVVESVSTAIATRGPASAVTVVLGPEPEPLREALSGTGVDIAINEHWSDGLSSSLRLGIQSLPPGTSAVLIVLADQALVASDEYQRLLDVARTNPERPIAAAYDDTVGVPAVFPARYFERLSALQGDRGAGSLLKSDDQVVPIDMPSAAFDIDTPEQLAAALKDPETPVALMV
jgi:molybdenum cofactor cytidylyltransferase